MRLRLLLLALLLSPVPLARAAEPDAAKLAEIRSRMQAFVDQGELAGAVTIVGRKDGIVSHEAVGLLTKHFGPPTGDESLRRRRRRF